MVNEFFKTSKILKQRKNRFDRGKKRVGGVSRPTSSGGTIIVTRTGQVTERDVEGKIVSKQQLTGKNKERAERFVERGTAENLAFLEEQRQARKGVESREEYLQRLVNSRVVTDEGRAEAREELKNIRLQKNKPFQARFKKTEQRLTDLRTESNIRRIQKEQTGQVLKAINEGGRKPKLKEKLILDKLTEFQAQKLRTDEKRKQLKQEIREQSTTGVFRKGDIQELTDIRQIPLRIRSIGEGVKGGALGVASLATKEGRTGFIQSFTQPKVLAVETAKEFVNNPLRTIAEFRTFSKLTGDLGRVAKRSPVGLYLQKEYFLLQVPKTYRPSVRKILNSALAQRKLNPKSIEQINKAKLVQPKELTPAEFKAGIRAIKKTDSIIFGSEASSIIGGKKLPQPKDLDIATSVTTAQFKKAFVMGLPQKTRKDYVLRGEKIIHKPSGRAVFDVKGIDRLKPNASIFGKGYLPVNLVSERVVFGKKSFPLPEIKKSLVTGLEVPTSKTLTASGVKIVGFGEQTLRKALGTIQVLLEKNVRRAKDPQSLLVGLEVQKSALQKAKPSTAIGRLRNQRRIKLLNDAIKLLKSKDFAKLLDKKVPGLTKEFPLVSKINTKSLKNVKITDFKTIDNLKITKKGVKQVKTKKTTQQVKQLKELKTSELPSSKLPRSVLPTSRLPSSRLPSSKLPKSKTPSSKLTPSKLPKSYTPISNLPVSKLPTSKLPISQIPTSKLPSSKLPSSKLPLSKLPSSKLPQSKLPSSKLPKSTLPPSKTTKTRIPKKKTTTKKQGQGYVVLVRKKGKFTPTKQVFTRQQAEAVGRYITDNSVRASYKIQASNKPINYKKKLPNTPKKFRTSKKTNVIRVEKRKYRIDSLGEVLGLKASKVAKNIGVTFAKVPKAKRRPKTRTPLRVSRPTLKPIKLKIQTIKGL